ncbi:PREDICTED: scavenger receptor class B member 1-like isoform X2 [Nicrophorus vespilloides]|nr:PREDICTED: scavenger receptor class B member 1-like isoform X2 [Nicrophorus vespilloides]XP_017781149.1 PREDICTED: scavenger receptor class B member 1-like isoform X2 [Nicrophorus vespilloides]
MVIKHGPNLDLTTKKKVGPPTLLLKGLIYACFGVILLIWTPFTLILDERIRMHTSLPAYIWWKSPPELLYLKAHVFNYTNTEAWFAGIDEKLNVVDLGPIVYMEYLRHTNVTFNDNSTITYVANHTTEYLPELNTIDLDDYITVPNYPLLSILSYLHDAPIFTKFAMNMLKLRLGSKVFVNVTVRDFLWNFSDPIMKLANEIVPSLVPVSNIGVLSRVYENFADVVTMYYGSESGHERFSLIDKFSGSEYLPNYKKCKDTLVNSTEGVTYSQYLTKKSVLRYWRKTICKVMELNYESDVVREGLAAYRYVVPASTFNRTYPPEDDCYKGTYSLPNGLTDLSACFFQVPLAASFPHFLHGDDIIKHYVTGLTPNESLHESFVIAEPYSGVPLEQVARSQSNLIMHKMSGFGKDISKFSETVLPMFWLEYHQIGIPSNIRVFLYIVTVLLTPLQTILIGALFFVAALYVLKFGKETAKANLNRVPFFDNRISLANVKEREGFLHSV